MNTTLPAYLNATAAKDVTCEADTDLFTCTGHGFVAGDPVVFSDLTGGTGITAGNTYYVIAANLAADAFQVSATQGGTTINVTTDVTAGKVTRGYSWLNAKKYFSPEDQGWIAKYALRHNGALMTDASSLHGDDLRDFFVNRRLPA